MSRQTATRRRFLQTSLAASAVAMSGRVRAQDEGGGDPRAEKLNLAIIGAAGRGRANTKGVASENIYALCDVSQAALDEASKVFPAAQTFTDWRKVVELPQIDGVVVRRTA